MTAAQLRSGLPRKTSRFGLVDKKRLASVRNSELVKSQRSVFAAFDKLFLSREWRAVNPCISILPDAILESSQEWVAHGLKS